MPHRVEKVAISAALPLEEVRSASRSWLSSRAIEYQISAKIAHYTAEFYCFNNFQSERRLISC